MLEQPLVSVVMPCLNEEEAIGDCIRKIRRTFVDAGLKGEIVVCDNGSTDSSVDIAEALGANVVHEPMRGYGNAYRTGFANARGKYLIMGDADDTYDFSLIPVFLDKLTREGHDFVTGSRYLGGGERNITFLHRIFGNPLLTRLLNGFFGTHYTDVYCGFRGFSRDAYEDIQPVSPGMEFNLELAINAGLAKLKTTEVPISLAPRKGTSKLRTMRDGWRSLRMMLLYCPNKVFFWPGGLLLACGLFLHLAMLVNGISWAGRTAGAITGVLATVLSVVGFQTISLGLHAKSYSWSRRFEQDNSAIKRFYSKFRLENGLLLGSGLLTVGITLFFVIVKQWLQEQMLPLSHPEWASLAATLVIVGCGTIFSSLFISAMSIEVAPSIQERIS